MDLENISFENSVPFYANVGFQFLYPLVDICGILGNSWILFTLMFGKVKISKTTKLYYLIIGISDLFIVTNNFVWCDICDSLLLWTNGNLGYCWDTVSITSCIIFNLWYYLAETTSNYSLVALSIERLIAVCYPLKAKSILTRKFTLYLLFFLVVPLLVLFSVLILFSSRIIPYLNTSDYVCHIDYENIFGMMFNFCMPVIVLGLHTFIDLIVSFVLFFKLYLARRKSHLISKSQQSSAELTATLVLIMLCTCTMIIYGITLFIYIATVIFDYFLRVAEEISLHFSTLMHLSLALTPLPHSINIFIYLAFIPSFRHSAFCKLYKISPRLEYSTFGKTK